MIVITRSIRYVAEKWYYWYVNKHRLPLKWRYVCSDRFEITFFQCIMHAAARCIYRYKPLVMQESSHAGILPEMVKVAYEEEVFLELLLVLVHTVWEER